MPASIDKCIGLKFISVEGCSNYKEFLPVMMSLVRFDTIELDDSEELKQPESSK